MTCFNPRPGPSTGATTSAATSRLVTPCFNPRPGPSTGATAPIRPCSVSVKFQSAPRSFDRGDTVELPTVTLRDGFNPRPGPSTGATQRYATVHIPLTCFNPRPGPSTGATLGCRRDCRLPGVSIRAPVLRPGRLPGRGPSQRIDSVSIRAPVLRPGRPPLNFPPLPYGTVSIRAPVLRPGRLQIRTCYVRIAEFQSAPRSFDRGDALQRGELLRDGVSIRAPVLRPGRHAR